MDDRTADHSTLARLRRAILLNKGLPVCQVGTEDRGLIESALERFGSFRFPVSLGPAPPGAFLNFDGVWLVEERSLSDGKFWFPEDKS